MVGCDQRRDAGHINCLHGADGRQPPPNGGATRQHLVFLSGGKAGGSRATSNVVFLLEFGNRNLKKMASESSMIGLEHL